MRTPLPSFYGLLSLRNDFLKPKGWHEKKTLSGTLKCSLKPISVGSRVKHTQTHKCFPPDARLSIQPCPVCHSLVLSWAPAFLWVLVLSLLLSRLYKRTIHIGERRIHPNSNALNSFSTFIPIRDPASLILALWPRSTPWRLQRPTLAFSRTMNSKQQGRAKAVAAAPVFTCRLDFASGATVIPYKSLDLTV